METALMSFQKNHQLQIQAVQPLRIPASPHGSPHGQSGDPLSFLHCNLDLESHLKLAPLGPMPSQRFQTRGSPGRGAIMSFTLNGWHTFMTSHGYLCNNSERQKLSEMQVLAVVRHSWNRSASWMIAEWRVYWSASFLASTLWKWRWGALSPFG